MLKLTRRLIFVLVSTFFVAMLVSMAQAAIGYGIDEMQRKYDETMGVNYFEKSVGKEEQTKATGMASGMGEITGNAVNGGFLAGGIVLLLLALFLGLVVLFKWGFMTWLFKWMGCTTTSVALSALPPGPVIQGAVCTPMLIVAIVFLAIAITLMILANNMNKGSDNNQGYDDGRSHQSDLERQAAINEKKNN